MRRLTTKRFSIPLIAGLSFFLVALGAMPVLGLQMVTLCAGEQMMAIGPSQTQACCCGLKVKVCDVPQVCYFDSVSLARTTPFSESIQTPAELTAVAGPPSAALENNIRLADRTRTHGVGPPRPLYLQNLTILC